MDIVKFAIEKPVTVTVGVILVVMFGLIGLTAIPIQLTPTVDQPIITVETSWPGRSPQEIVDEVTKVQEEELKNTTGLKRMKSLTSQGLSTIELEFYLQTDINRARQEVSDALRQVPDYPEEVEEPVITVADGASENAIAWIIVDLDPDHIDDFPGFEVAWLFDPLDKQVKPELERIDGVAEVNIFGGREREVRVYVDTSALAQRGLNHNDLVAALRGENRNVTAGTIAEGKRDYRVRLLGQFTEPQQVLDTIIDYRETGPIYVRDIATVEVGYEKRRGFVRTFGHPSIAMNVIRQNGANVVDVMEGVRETLDRIRADILPNIAPEGYEAAGPHLRIRQVYDETTYIDSAISLVTQNLYIGGAIAAVVLMLFLRSVASTVIIAVAIPISVIGTFLVMLALGRTLNVISLAGLAFAVGMVVDNAIVVLENIYRRLQNGDPPLRAAYQGGREVWGAILASTLTTAAVFVPVLTIQEESGQLFRDIALAIVAAVVLSLIVSITVIPTAAARYLRAAPTRQSAFGRAFRGLFGLDALFSRLVSGFAATVRWLMTGWRAWTLRPAAILGLTAVSILGAVALAPPLDYLPAGNRNLVFGGLSIPPGYSVEQLEEVAQGIERHVQPYVDASAEDPASYRKLPPIMRFDRAAGVPLEPFEPLPVQNFFIGSFGGSMFAGGTSEFEETVIPVGALLTNAMNQLGSDIFGGAQQSSLFGRGAGGGGSSVDIEVSGVDLDRVLAAGSAIYNAAGRRYGFGISVSNEPGNFDLQRQEVRLSLTETARELGVRNADAAAVIRALFDGAFIDDYKLNGENVDLVAVPSGGRLEYKEQLAAVPVYTPAGRIVPMDTLVEFVPALAPQEIQRIEELPAVTISVRPQENVPVERLIAELERDIIAPVVSDPSLWNPRTMRINLEGTAAKLNEVRTALFGAAPTSGLAAGGNASLPQRILFALTAIVGIAGLGVALYAAVRAVRRRSRRFAAGSVGALLIALAAGLPLFLFGLQPELALARMVWALAVTYLLMCALFESFVYPFVIMFSVPLAVVGGFAGLAIVHNWSLADPTKAPQQLDVLTMLGFVILIGVVVNNAILIVHQALNFMRGVGESADDRVQPMAPIAAIAESVRTRVRPIFMGALTSVGGMLPLVLFPGAGSEMYRGLGSVIVGGLLVSTVFTLLLVPLLFSLVLEAVDGLKAALATSDRPATAPTARDSAPELQPA